MMAMVNVIREHIEIVEGAGGPKARIVGHQIRVVDVVEWHEKMGMSADQIVKEFPTISKADVYAALAYYCDHRDEIEAKIAEDEALVEEMKRMQGPNLLEQKLKLLRRG
jgi:uncharacterized protein (DUF433 family)